VVKTQEILKLKLYIYLQLSFKRLTPVLARLNLRAGDGSYGSGDSGLISANVCHNARQKHKSFCYY